MSDVFNKWQSWRNKDQEDNAVLSRHEVITLLAEIERLRTELKEARDYLETLHRSVFDPP